MHAQPLKTVKPPIALRRADQEALLAVASHGLVRNTRSAGAPPCEAAAGDPPPGDDAALARDFIARYTVEYGPLRLPLLVGVLPLFNARHAAFLHNEVPGIVIPETLRARLAAAGEGPAAAEGVAIAVELLAELRGLVQGVYLMPPFGRYDLAAEILDRVQVKA